MDRIQELERVIDLLVRGARLAKLGGAGLDADEVIKLCEGVLPKMLHEIKGVRRRRLTSDYD
jgi:hypothetical protein